MYPDHVCVLDIRVSAAPFTDREVLYQPIDQSRGQLSIVSLDHSVIICVIIRVVKLCIVGSVAALFL